MFSTIELTGMRDTQEAHMMDTCVIYRVTGKKKNARGVYEKVLDAGTESICGVQLDPMALSGDNMRMAEVDAIVRLPAGTEVQPEDEIEVTARFGCYIKLRRFIVDRFTNEGASGARAYLKTRSIV